MHLVAFYFSAYFLGSIPFGWLVAKAKGIDIRKVGSGNIGATNVGRALGKKYAVLVFLLDFIKGFLPVWLAFLTFGKESNHIHWHLIAIALLTVIGHNYPIWLKFKGGKGVATSAGALLALLPIPLLICVAVWGVVFYSTRYVSVASLTGAVVLPMATYFFQPQLPYLILTLALMILGFIRHRSNIAALIAGKEHQFTKKDDSL